MVRLQGGQQAAQAVISLATVLSNLSVGIQNCNSLNVSTNCPKQLKKIKAITDMSHDIIFLSDLRLSNSDAVSDLKTIFCSTANNQYNFLYNSSRNSRGTGILLTTSREWNIIDTYRDESENILGIHSLIDNHHFIFISIYGPNHNNQLFFRDLRRCIAMNPDANFIIGGDWNLTYSTANTQDNIDIFNMLSPPSTIRSRALADIYELHNLSDPFRSLHPDKRDFTFRPRNNQPYRSRLDFFLISNTLLELISKCEISPGISTELFDHHSVMLLFNAKKYNTRQSINYSILNHPHVEYVISAATVDCYLNHAIVTPELGQGRAEVGAYMTTLREINDLEYQICLHGTDPNLELQLAGKTQTLMEQKDLLPTPEQLDGLALSCRDDTFLEVLMGSIRSSIISFQSWVRKLATLKKTALIVRINSLRDNFIINSGTISDLQAELNEIIEAEIREKIKAMKLFEGLHSEKPSPIFLSLARNKNKGNLDNIKDDTGAAFNTEQECGEYIASFFEKLYKIPVDEVNLPPRRGYLQLQFGKELQVIGRRKISIRSPTDPGGAGQLPK